MSDKMSGFDCYATWCAVGAHFRRGNYNYFKYHGKIRASKEKYQTRKDKYYFEKMSSKWSRDQIFKWMVSVHIDKDIDTSWIGNLINPRTEVAVKKWRKRIESLTYNFKEELSQIQAKEENFNNLFVIVDGKHPYAFRLYQRGMVSLETLVLLDDLVHFTKHWSKHDDLMLNELIELIQKYRPFLYHFTNADNEKLKQIVLETYS